MASTHTWSATPRTRRVLADLASVMPEDTRSGVRLALLIGAGVDKSLTNRPLWADFLKAIAKKSFLPSTEHVPLKRIAKNLPVEMAEALRIAVGREAYDAALWQQTKSGKIVSGNGHKMSAALGSLVKNGVRLIMSFNYTQDVVKAVKSSHPNTTIIQRAHLEGWTKLDLLHPATGVLHFIAIHGLVDERSGEPPYAILDQHSYDEAIFSDLHYSELIQRLLQDYTVLSIGLSWEDVALRSAAARVHYASPICGHTHVALFPRSKNSKSDLWRERGMVAAYSVRPLYYDPRHDHAGVITTLEEIPQLLESMNHIPHLPTKLDEKGIHTLGEIADVLDVCGDYEALFQRTWFPPNWEPLAGLLSRCNHPKRSFHQWTVFARLERHLRHFLWVYVTPQKRMREVMRMKVWQIIAGTGIRLFKTHLSRIKFDDDSALGPGKDFLKRGIFEFALGAYEFFSKNEDAQNGGSNAAYWREFLARIKSTKLKQRVEMAKNIWRVHAQVDSLIHLRRQAIKSEWESIESKIVLDICEFGFKREMGCEGRIPRSLSEQQKRKLLGQALDAREVARMAGCGRRELGAVALSSLVADTERAETDLVGILQGFARRTESGAGPVGDWDIYVGLLATLIDRRSTKKIRHEIKAEAAKEWLEDRCGKINCFSFGGTSDVKDVIHAYWKDFHPEAATLAEGVAQIVYQEI